MPTTCPAGLRHRFNTWWTCVPSCCLHQQCSDVSVYPCALSLPRWPLPLPHLLGSLLIVPPDSVQASPPAVTSCSHLQVQLGSLICVPLTLPAHLHRCTDSRTFYVGWSSLAKQHEGRTKTVLLLLVTVSQVTCTSPSTSWVLGKYLAYCLPQWLDKMKCKPPSTVFSIGPSLSCWASPLGALTPWTALFWPWCCFPWLSPSLSVHRSPFSITYSPSPCTPPH